MLAFLALAHVAAANLIFRSPVASTTATGGSALQLSWEDDGKAPALADIGAITLGLYVGTPTQQVQVQAFGAAEASAGELDVTIQATAGPNGNFYFVRADNTSNSPINFSARFTLSGMTGTLPAGANATTSGPASVAVSSAAPLPAAVSPTSQAAAAASAASKPAGNPVVAAASASTTASKSAPSNGAGRVAISAGLVLAAGAIAVNAL